MITQSAILGDAVSRSAVLHSIAVRHAVEDPYLAFIAQTSADLTEAALAVHATGKSLDLSAIDFSSAETVFDVRTLIEQFIPNIPIFWQPAPSLSVERSHAAADRATYAKDILSSKYLQQVQQTREIALSQTADTDDATAIASSFYKATMAAFEEWLLIQACEAQDYLATSVDIRWDMALRALQSISEMTDPSVSEVKKTVWARLLWAAGPDSSHSLHEYLKANVSV
jgi:hypothetical protein